MAAGKASGRTYAAKAGFGCCAGKELDDGRGNAGCAFVTLALHEGLDVAALRQLFAVKGFQTFDDHQVGTGDSRAGVAAQAYGIGVVVSEDAVFGRAEEVGQCVLDGDGRGLVEE